MKICIVTVYNSLNYGAYLQAYALNKVLNDYKNEVSFLKTGARKPFKTTFKLFLSKLLKFKFKEAKFELIKLLNFQGPIKKFNTLTNNENLLKMQDIIVFGSDEIWNISRKGVKDYPILFGKGIPDNYFVSYAPSINTTNLEQIKESIDFQEAIEKFNRISVRDYHSLNTLKKITSKDIDIVLDPTFLLKKNVYSELEEECNERDFILVYGYNHDFTGEQINKIKEFAKSVNLKLISVGFYNNWCDESVAASPFMFLSFMKNAKFVITNTFHGTIFSIIYNKQFVTYAGNKVKIIDILKRLNLENRIVTDQQKLGGVIKDQIDYQNVKTILEEQINNSYVYIKASIERGENDENIA